VVALVGVFSALLFGAGSAGADSTGLIVTPLNTVATEGGAAAQYKIERAGDVPLTDVTVTYAITGSTADVDTPTPASGFTLDDTTPSVTISVPALDDGIYEPADEAFSLNLTPSVGSPQQAAGTVHSEDPVPAMTINNVSLPEGDSGTKDFTFSVTLSNPSSASISASWNVTQYGSAPALAGSDYVEPATTPPVNFAPGETSKTITIQVIGDPTQEPDEQFLVTLSGYANITDSQGVGTILNNDDPAPTPTLKITGVTVTEGVNANAVLTVTRTGSGAVSVKAQTNDGTAKQPADYIAFANTDVNIPANQTTGTVQVPINNDAIDEAAETFTVTIYQPSGATIPAGDEVATVTINDNDNNSALRVNDVSVNEPASGATIAANFTVTLQPASERTVTVPFSLTGVSAAAGSDYTATSGTLTFVPGDTSEQVTVTVLGDAINEAVETFNVVLGAPVGATVADATGQGTIVDPSAPPALTISDTSGSEGAGTIPVTVTLAGTPSGQNITVNYTVQTGDNFPNASPGADFTAATGTLTFTPGQTSKTISIAVVNDTVAESNENITVVLSNASGATIAKAKATVTIVDNDSGDYNPPPTGGGGGGGGTTPGTTTPGALPITTAPVTAKPSSTTTVVRTLAATKLTSAKINPKLVSGRRQVALKVSLTQDVLARVTMVQGKQKIVSAQFQLIAGNRTVFVLLPKTIKKGPVSLSLALQNSSGARKTLLAKVTVKPITVKKATVKKATAK
jgi:hypothetical protein